MVDEKKLLGVRRALQRIFALPMTKSTFREVQNAIANQFENNRDEANSFLELLLRGEVKGDVSELGDRDELEKLIEFFSIPTWVAKDVHEKGDFINLITSDILTQNNQVLCANRIRKIDGEEFQFLTDPESTLQLLQHFLVRIQELEKNERTRPVITRNRPQLESLKQKLDELLGASKVH